MFLGKVVGCVWSTVKNPELRGLRMLLVQPVTPDLEPAGRQLVCTDSTGAGAGEVVYWVRGREASLPFLPAEPATDATIVGIVDSVHLGPPVAAVPVPQPAAEIPAPQPPAARRRRPARKDAAC